MGKNFGPGIMGGVVLVDPSTGQPYKASDITAGDLVDPLTSSGAALKAAYVAQGQTSLDLGKQAGVDPTGVTECAAGLNTALAACAALGVRAFARGTFKIASTVTILGNADLGDARFKWYGAGTGVAVQVGAGGSGVVLSGARVTLPSIENWKKTTVGWAQAGVTGTTGVKGINLDTCSITVTNVFGFETGLHFYGQGGGFISTTVHLGILNNNKVNHLLSADATGWVNENKTRGGKMSYSSNEGPTVAGARDILIPVTTNLINNNVWDCVSLEGNTPEYHVECGGLNNEWKTCRWENPTGCRVYWITPADKNQILGGYGAQTIVQTLGASALPQNVISAARWDLGTYLPTGLPVSTAWSTRIDSQGIRVKPYSNGFDRIFLETATGKVWFGGGTADPVVSFGATGSSGVSLFGGNLYSGTDATYDIGLASSLRFRDLNLTRNAVVPGTLKLGGFTISYGTAAPTTGAHIVGDEHKNSVPTVGQPKAWLCTVAGTPGTWVSTGNL